MIEGFKGLPGTYQIERTSNPTTEAAESPVRTESQRGSMHVLIFTNHFAPENFRINDLAFGLVERGHRVTVMTGLPNYPVGKIFPGYGYFKRRRETINGVHVIRLPLIPRGRGRTFNLFINYVSSTIAFCLLSPFVCREKYDAVFVFATSPSTIGLPGVLLRRIKRAPVVLWILDLWPESLSATGAVKNRFVLGAVRRIIRFIYRRCDKILISSRGFEKSVRQVGGYEGNVDYFPNWVEPSVATSPTDTEKEQLPDLPNGFRIMFTGNIGVAQDFPTILEAASMLKAYRDIHWVIVGDGRQAEWVKAEVEKRGLSDQFHLVGRFPLHTMPHFYQEADALLLPLKNEPIFALTAPGKLQSYLAAGKPVIAALNGEGADIVRSANAGVACGAENAEGLRDAVLALYQMSDADRAAMGRRGADFARKNFDRQMLFDQLEQTLRDVGRA